MLNRLARACAGLAARRPRLVLVLFALPALALAYPALQVRYDGSLEMWFLESDPALRTYQEFQSVFGNDDYLVVRLDGGEEGIFRPDLLESLERLTAAIETEPYVARVSSLSRQQLLRTRDDELFLEPALPPLPADEGAIAAARDRVLADRRAVRTVISEDGREATVLVEIEQLPGEFEYRLELARRVREILDAERDVHGIRYRLMGDAVLHADVFAKILHDLRLIVPLALGVIAIVVWLAFGSVAATGLAVVLVLSALVMTRTGALILGWGDNDLLAIVPLVVMVTGVADTIHILDRFYELRRAGCAREEAAERTVLTLFKPCLFTSLTTVISFLALTITPLFPLRQLGVLAAIGVGSAFAYSVLPLPAALGLMGGIPERRAEGGRLRRTLDALPRFVARRRGWILAAAALLTAAGVAGILRLQVESRYLDAFRRHDPIRVEAEWFEEHAGGLASVEAVVTAPEPGGLMRPEVLEAMDGLARVLEAEPMVSRAHSVVDHLKLVNEVMHDGDSAQHRVPDRRALAAQYLLLYESVSDGELDRWVDLPRTRGRIWARSRFGTFSEYDAMKRQAREYVAESFPEDVTVRLTGVVTLFKNMSRYIVQSQVRSFFLAFCFITAALGFVFGSFRLALVSLIPNVWPIALTVGFMGWAGWWLEPATALVAPVAIGIAVDDSVHFLHNYLEARRRGEDRPAAVAAMFARAGRAVTVTTLILVVGFAIGLLSSLKETALFAGLCMMALSLALAGDLFILPAVLLSSRRRGNGSS